VSYLQRSGTSSLRGRHTSVVAKFTSEITDGCSNTPFLSSPIAYRLLCRPRYLCQSFGRLPASVLSLCLLIAWPCKHGEKAALRVGAAASATSLTETRNTPGQQLGSNVLLPQSYSFGRFQGGVVSCGHNIGFFHRIDMPRRSRLTAGPHR